MPRWWIFRFSKMQVTPRVHVRLLASQDGICSTKFVRKKRSTNPISIVCFSGRLTGSVGKDSLTFQVLQRRINQHRGPTWNKRKSACELTHSPLRCQRQVSWLTSRGDRKCDSGHKSQRLHSYPKGFWCYESCVANESKIQQWFAVYLMGQPTWSQDGSPLQSVFILLVAFVNVIRTIWDSESGTLAQALGLGVSQVHFYSI